jgi:hypothetical protein
MKVLITALALVFSLTALPVPGLPIEVGGLGGGGLCFTFGSWLDARAAQLADQTASGVTLGTSQARLFPGLSAGAYGQLGLLSWLDLRLELRVSYLGASRLALTAAAVPFDAYGIGFYALMLPVLARGSWQAGPGRIIADAGPFYGIVVGGVMAADTYTNVTTSALITMSASQASMIGLTGGVGYEIGLGPGILSVEARADGVLLPATLDAGLVAGGVAPLDVIIVVGYGFRFGGTP